MKTETILNVLSLEDSDADYEIIGEQLIVAGLNINIIRAVTGDEAVDICRLSRSVDLILMDLKIPVMNGFEATRLIREFKSDIPIIAQTAYSSDHDMQKALACGCNDFISKPFKRAAIVSKIREHLCIAEGR